jgi:hypothetical protein
VAKKNSVAKKNRRPRPAQDSPLGSPVDVVTVGWMLSVTTTLVCAGIAAIVWLFVHGRPNNEFAMLLVRYLHFSAVVTAVVSLALLAAVLKMRREAPPSIIVAVAVIVASLPILAALW